MADISPQDMAAKLLASSFERSGPSATTLSDPIADTPIVVTLDQLRPYDHDPRVARNPAYEDIKASIRERGLDAAPAITRRPGEVHYLIRNGGNTRLAILRELWSETKDERFFRITCLFRPWPERGEVVMLTGHLAENELRGGLTFIERALGVEKVRGYYEEEDGRPLSQSELARRLAADGFPVAQPHISRMQDAVRYLLPAIPTVLYAGLGRRQIERLTALRKAGERIWQTRATQAKGQSLSTDFPALFQDVLAPFDMLVEEFSVQRVQDELVGQMADLLGTDYDTLSLELDDAETRQRALVGDPVPGHATSAAASPAPASTMQPQPLTATAEPSPSPSSSSCTHAGGKLDPRTASVPQAEQPDEPRDEQHREPRAVDAPTTSGNPEVRLQAHIASPAPTTERLQTIQRMVAEQMGDAVSMDFERNVLQAIPVQAGGLYPITDVWYIDPGIDTSERLRIHIGQFALEIADEAALGPAIVQCEDGLGFRCLPLRPDSSWLARTVWALLASMTGTDPQVDGAQLTADLPALLHGKGNPSSRLSDTALVKLFRVLRLARRLVDLESGASDHDPNPGHELGDGT